MVDGLLQVRGGRPLNGEITVRGAKNLVPKAMVAALLGATPSLLRNVPLIRDVDVVSGLLSLHGVAIDYDQTEGVLRLDPSRVRAAPISFWVAADVTDAAALAAVRDVIDAERMPVTVIADIDGDDGRPKSLVKADGQGWLILGVVLAVYLVLGILYENLLHPITVLSTIPSAGVGALLALWASNTPFSLIALLGLFLLIGVVMKNGILMIDVALKKQLHEGLAPQVAILQAAGQRLRPILMTNVAALAGASACRALPV